VACARAGEGKYAEAEAIYRTLLAVDKENFEVRMSLCTALTNQGKHAEAEIMGRALLADERRVLGHEHPLTLKTASDMLIRLGQQGRYDEAEIRDLWAVRKRVLGPEHPDTLVTAETLAVALGAHGKYDEAVSLHREVLTVQLRIMGREHPHTQSTAKNMYHHVSCSRMAEPPCYVCHKPAPKKCSSCKVAAYCSAVCQKKHWGAHKKDCASLRKQ